METTEINPIVIRLNKFLNDCNISRSQFADTCGIPRSTITQLLSGKYKKIGDDIISQIHTTYPSISMMWLLFGDGEEGYQPDKYISQSSENSIFSTNIMDDSEFSAQKQLDKVNSTCNELNISKQIVNKEIKKIVVFFSDNSFEESILKK